MIEVSAVLKSLVAGAEMVRSLSGGVAAARQRSREVAEAKQLLGLKDPVGEAYRSDSVHPLYSPGEIHPDNRAALSVAGSDALARQPVVRDGLRVDPTDHSLLLFGSPTSEGLSRIVFGYEEIAGVEGLDLRDPPLDLRYAWELNPESVGEGKVGRYVPGKGLVERPLWQIKDLQRPAAGRLIPESNNGLLSEDYLLVTRMRNFLSAEALDSGKFVVSFGGAHGTGTRAVELLIRDKRLMTTVLEELKSKQARTTGRVGGVPKAYQLLFRIPLIRHRARGSIPGALELVDAVVLPDAEATWDHARRRAAPRLKRDVEQDNDKR